VLLFSPTATHPRGHQSPTFCYREAGTPFGRIRPKLASFASKKTLALVVNGLVTPASVRRFCGYVLPTSSTLARPRDRLHGARGTLPVGAVSECGFRVRDNAHGESRWHAGHHGFVSRPPQRLARGVRSRAVSQYVRDDRGTRYVSNRDQRGVVHDRAAHDRGVGKARRALPVPVCRHPVPHHRSVANELTSVGRSSKRWHRALELLLCFVIPVSIGRQGSPCPIVANGRSTANAGPVLPWPATWQRIYHILITRGNRWRALSIR